MDSTDKTAAGGHQPGSTIKPGPLDLRSSFTSTQLPKKRNHSMDSNPEDDERKKLQKGSTSSSSIGPDEQGTTVGENVSVIDLSVSVNDNRLNVSNPNEFDESTMSHKNLSQEMNEAMSSVYGAKDPRRDFITKHFSDTRTSTPTRYAPSLLSNFVRNMFIADKRLNHTESGLSFTATVSDGLGNKSMDENTALTLENNRCLKEIAKVLDGIGKSVGGLEERLDHLEIHVDNTRKLYDESLAKVNSQLTENTRLIEVLSGEITAKTDEAKQYTDSKILAVTQELPNMLATMGDDVDKKLSHTTSTLLHTIDDRVGVLPTRKVVVDLVNQGLTTYASENSLVTKADLCERIGTLPNLEAVSGLCEKSMDTFAQIMGC